MRSLLFVPGDSEKKLEKALASGADVLIVDLEDSVAGARKDAARDIAEGFIRESRKKTSARLYVRVNDFDSGMTDGDLAAIIGARPDGIMLPKCAGSVDVMRLAVKLRVLVGLAVQSLLAATASGLSASTSKPVSPSCCASTRPKPACRTARPPSCRS